MTPRLQQPFATGRTGLVRQVSISREDGKPTVVA